MNIVAYIEELMKEHGFSEYRLAKEAGLHQSTVANIFHRNTVPSFVTLEAICHAFGMTLGQFFSRLEQEEVRRDERSELLRKWEKLRPEQQGILNQLMREFLGE